MFENGYVFRLATKRVIRNEYPLIEKLVYTFKTVNKRKYIVDIHRYEYGVYVIKFHDKVHTSSANKYNFVLNDFDVSKVLRTVLSIALEVLDGDKKASFAFVGAHKKARNQSQNRKVRDIEFIKELPSTF